MQRQMVVCADAWLLSPQVCRRQSAPADESSGAVDGLLSVAAIPFPSGQSDVIVHERVVSLSSAVSEARHSLRRALTRASCCSLASTVSEARRLLARSRSVANRLSLSRVVENS